jgi:hypothetical protein
VAAAIAPPVQSVALPGLAWRLSERQLDDAADQRADEDGSSWAFWPWRAAGRLRFRARTALAGAVQAFETAVPSARSS